MIKFFLSFLLLSSVLYAQNSPLPEGINRRIGSELDSSEADYFGLFSWVKGFKSARISSFNGELMFRISRKDISDTVFTFSSKNSEYLNTYITRFEDIFTDQEVGKSIDWTDIAVYLRPSAPFQKVQNNSVVLMNQTSSSKPLIWYNDSLIAFWNTPEDIGLLNLERKIEVLKFNEIKEINGWPVHGKHEAFSNILSTFKGKSLFARIPPEVNAILKSKISTKQSEVSNSAVMAVPLIQPELLNEYVRMFTFSIATRQKLLVSENKVSTTSYYPFQNSDVPLNHSQSRWYADIAYNFNRYLSLGLSYDYSPETGKIDNNKDITISGSVISLSTYIHPLPRNPVHSMLEPQIGFSIGQASYSFTQYMVGLNGHQKRTTIAKTWEASGQVSVRIFPFRIITFQTGMLYRRSGSMSVPEWTYALSPQFPHFTTKEANVKLSQFELFLMSSIHL